MTPTLGAITLNGVSRIEVEKNANIIPIPIPTLDSDESEVFDLLGVVKLLSIDGTYSVGTVAATKAFVDSVESLITGDQSPINFTSDQTGTVSVMVNQVRTVWDIPGFTVNFSIKLIQGTQG